MDKIIWEEAFRQCISRVLFIFSAWMSIVPQIIQFSRNLGKTFALHVCFDVKNVEIAKKKKEKKNNRISIR